MSTKNKKAPKLDKKPYVLKVGYAQFKKGEKVMLTKEGAAYLKSLHKI